MKKQLILLLSLLVLSAPAHAVVYKYNPNKPPVEMDLSILEQTPEVQDEAPEELEPVELTPPDVAEEEEETPSPAVASTPVPEELAEELPEALPPEEKPAAPAHKKRLSQPFFTAKTFSVRGYASSEQEEPEAAPPVVKPTPRIVEKPAALPQPVEAQPVEEPTPVWSAPVVEEKPPVPVAIPAPVAKPLETKIIEEPAVVKPVAPVAEEKTFVPAPATKPAPRIVPMPDPKTMMVPPKRAVTEKSPAPVADAPKFIDEPLPAGLEPMPSEPLTEEKPVEEKTVEPKVEATPAPAAETKAVVPSHSDLTLEFDPPSSQLSPAAQKKLDDITAQLKESEGMRIQIRAFAQATDGPSSARRMALSRALMVRSYLTDKGIKPTRLDVRALGSETDTTPLDRVDLVFVK